MKEYEKERSSKSNTVGQTEITKDGGEIDFNAISTKEDFRKVADQLIQSGIAVEKKD